MRDVTVSKIPDCDVCPVFGRAPRSGLYNAPTRPGSGFGGKWGNLCEEDFAEHGIDTSVTERRVVA